MLEGLEKEARETRKGLWANPHPVPPWEWRKRRYLATNKKNTLDLQYNHFPTPRLAVCSFPLLQYASLRGIHALLDSTNPSPPKWPTGGGGKGCYLPKLAHPSVLQPMHK